MRFRKFFFGLSIDAYHFDMIGVTYFSAFPEHLSKPTPGKLLLKFPPWWTKTN